MANNLMQMLRTSVPGRIPNTTTMPNPGTFGINMADQIVYSTDGSAYFAIGANLVNQFITNSSTISNLLTVGNSTVNAVINSTTFTIAAISANGSIGSSGQVLTSNGTIAYWSTPAGGGDGTSVYQGNTTLDFGGTPTAGSNATITNANITSSSLISAFISAGDSTANNDANSHQIASAALQFIVTPGSGNFNLEAHCMFGLANGKFNVRYTYQ